MSSGTVNFPTIIVTITCNPRRLPFSESSAGPPTTSLRPEGFIAQKRRDAGAAPEEGSPTNARCKAPHLIKIILAYSPKKERADPIEDESEDENESGNPGHTHPGAYALLWRGSFYRGRGESREASRLTYFSESEEDLSSHLMTLNKKELLSM
ncbi:hypothetical protein AgCh_028598 [Apium graveolens]